MLFQFVGYDLGTSKLMHVSGKVSTMFPTDGAIIRSEKIDFVQGRFYVWFALLPNHCHYGA